MTDNTLEIKTYTPSPEKITASWNRSDANLVDRSPSLRTESSDLRLQTPTVAMNAYYGVAPKGIAGIDLTGLDFSQSLDATLDYVMEQANLDWPVYTMDGLPGDWEYANEAPRTIYTYDPNKMFDSAGNKTSDYSLADASLSGRLHFTTKVTKKWKPVQNETIVKTILKFCKEHETPLVVERAMTFNKGSQIAFVVNIDESFEVSSDDATSAKMVVLFGHIPGSVKILLLAERLVCKNGLVLPVTINEKLLKHTQVITPELLLKGMQAVKTKFYDYQKIAVDLANEPATASGILRLPNGQQKLVAMKGYMLDQIGLRDTNGDLLANQPQQVMDIINSEHITVSFIAAKAAEQKFMHPELVESGEVEKSKLNKAYEGILNFYNQESTLSSFQTAWGAFNGVTGWLNHGMSTRTMNGNTAEQAFTSSLFSGSRYQKSRQALNQLVVLSAL